MTIRINKESLSDITGKLKQAVDNYNKNIDDIIKELSDLNLFWSGTSYNNFIKYISKNKQEIVNSKKVLKGYYNVINSSYINYVKLSEGVHYNE